MFKKIRQTIDEARDGIRGMKTALALILGALVAILVIQGVTLWLLLDRTTPN